MWNNMLQAFLQGMLTHKLIFLSFQHVLHNCILGWFLSLGIKSALQMMAGCNFSFLLHFKIDSCSVNPSVPTGVHFSSLDDQITFLTVPPRQGHALHHKCTLILSTKELKTAVNMRQLALLNLLRWSLLVFFKWSFGSFCLAGLFFVHHLSLSCFKNPSWKHSSITLQCCALEWFCFF